MTMMALRKALDQGQRGVAWVMGFTLAGYFLKVAYEITTGGMVFVNDDEVSFVVVPLAAGIYPPSVTAAIKDKCGYKGSFTLCDNTIGHQMQDCLITSFK